MIGEVTSKSGSQFEMATVGEDTLVVYIDSTTGIDLGAVNVGDEYQVLSPVVVFNGLIELKPRYQSDLIEDPSGDTLPVISDVTVDNYVVLADAPVTISATISDNLGVDSATLYYRDSDGENPGAWASLPMSDMGGDMYGASIPAGHTGIQLDYYVEATDTGAQTVTLPGDAPDGFYELAVGITSIYDMQYVHPDSSGDNAYLDRVLNIRGVVTAGTGEVGPPSQFVVQEQETGPYGGYAFGGVLVYEGSAAGQYFRGDLVEMGGYGNEYFGITEMEPFNGNAINLISFGNQLPPAARVATGDLADDLPSSEDGDGRLGEAWESVWVKTRAAAVLDTLGFGEYIISDTEQRPDSLVVDPAVELTYQPTIGDVIFVEGFMDYAFGEFQITPIADQYITLTDWVPVEDTPTIEAAGGFENVFPNPFNPATNIRFVLNRDELTQLNIYNLRGQLVRTLVNERIPRGQYTLTWDGRDAEGQFVASGQYFARLRIGAEVMQVRKLSLVK